MTVYSGELKLRQAFGLLAGLANAVTCGRLMVFCTSNPAGPRRMFVQLPRASSSLHHDLIAAGRTICRAV